MSRFFFRYLPAILMLTTLGVVGAVIWSDLQKSTLKESVNTAQAETYPSALCTNGTAVIMRAGVDNITLRSGEKYSLVAGDVIKTLTEASNATIFWSEGSVTRLGGKTSLEIKETGTKDQRKVDFSLRSGKTYSRIFEYLRADEYFQERFDSGKRIASVRGTAFEVNADNGYIKSLDHTVEISDLEKKISSFLGAGKAVSLSDFAMEISQKLIDSTWENINSEQDKEALVKYAQALSEKFGNLSTILGSGSGQLISASGSEIHLAFDPAQIASGALSSAQMGTIEDFYYKVGGLDIPQETKNSLRSYLLESSTGSEQTLLEQDFAKHSLYDIAAAQKAGNAEMAKEIAKIMEQYKVDDVVKQSLESIKGSLNIGNLQEIQGNIQESIQKSIQENLPANIKETISSSVSSAKKDAALKKVENVNMKAEDIQKQAQQTVDSIFNSLSQ